METTRFDQAAATWDEKPQRVQLAHDIASAIQREAAVNDTMNVLDFGCGTGLLTLHLQPLVRTIIGADSSRAMLEQLNAKIGAAQLDNICSMFLDPDQEGPIQGKYHLVVSSMALHHIADLDRLFTRLTAPLLPGGLLCLADLDLEDGRFHEDNTGVHHFGFDRKALAAKITAAGLVDVHDCTASEIVKPIKDGGIGRFSVFLLTARKAKSS